MSRPWLLDVSDERVDWEVSFRWSSGEVGYGGSFTLLGFKRWSGATPRFRGASLLLLQQQQAVKVGGAAKVSILARLP
jgi:hypothetical protein